MNSFQETSNESNLMMVHSSSKRVAFLATYLRQQSWSVPDSIIYYASKSLSSAKLHYRLIKTCKYFYLKNPTMLITSSLIIANNSDNKWRVFADKQVFDCDKTILHFWITDIFRGNNYQSPDVNYISSCIPKIGRCDAKEISIQQQHISLNDLAFLVSKCEKITFCGTTIVDEDGLIVALENIILVFPKLKDFSWALCDSNASNTVTSKTVEKLLKIQQFLNLVEFTLAHFTENFDIETFFSYLKRNKKTKIYLYFSDQISNVYRTRLQEIVNEILADENRDYKMPFINFSEIEHDSYETMHILYNQN